LFGFHTLRIAQLMSVMLLLSLAPPVGTMRSQKDWLFG